MKYLTIILTILILFSCTNSREVNKTKNGLGELEIDFVTYNDCVIVCEAIDLKIIAQKVFPNASIITFDETYAFPKFEWMVYKFVPEYLKMLKENNIDKWTPQFDCDDYSSLFKMEVQKAYSRNALDHQGIAVGTIIYFTEGWESESHAINVVFSIGDDNKLGCLSIEPQNGSLVNPKDFSADMVWLVIL